LCPPKVCDGCSLLARRHRLTSHLSWSHVRFRVLCETAYRAAWVTRSRPGVIVSESPSRYSYRLRLPNAFAPGSSSRALGSSYRVSRATAGPALMSGHLPWASVPHRGVSLRSPHSRASQAHFVPSSTFLTSSTVYSSTDLCGFVSPRSHVQGSLFRGFPWREAARARRPPLPSCRLRGVPAPGFPETPEPRARLQGLAPLTSPSQHAAV